MGKFLYLLIFNSQFLIFNSFSQSPDWLWAKRIGGINYEQVYAMEVDGSGNVYTTGEFYGTVDFDPGVGTFNLTTYGYYDIFISKLNNAGNLVWVKQIGGAGSDAAAYALALDNTGCIYTTGVFDGTNDFNPGIGTFNLSSNGNYFDIFICKLDSSGNFVWAKKMGGSGNDAGNDIALDAVGNVYTTGIFDGIADFDPGAGIFNISPSSIDIYDIFISKLDSSGNFIWAKAMGGVASDEGRSVAIGSSGNIYITGIFQGVADFDPGAGTFYLTPAGGWDSFFTKLDNSGNFGWVKQLSGMNSEFVKSLKVDVSENVYTSGSFTGTVDFDPGTGIFNLISLGGSDIFISKFDNTGNFMWAKAIGGTGGDSGNSIEIDAVGNVYTAGSFNGMVDFDPGVGTFNLTSAGGGDIFISRLSSFGNFEWVKKVGGTGNEWGETLAFDTSGNLHIAGSFMSPTITFGSSSLFNSDNSGTYPDLFIAKLDTAFVTGINALENFGSGILIFPNPFSNSTTISFSLSQSQNVSLKIFDMSGRLVSTLADKSFNAGENKLVWNASVVNAGFYFLRIETACYSEIRKLSVTK